MNLFRVASRTQCRLFSSHVHGSDSVRGIDITIASPTPTGKSTFMFYTTPDGNKRELTATRFGIGDLRHIITRQAPCVIARMKRFEVYSIRKQQQGSKSPMTSEQIDALVYSGPCDYWLRAYNEAFENAYDNPPDVTYPDTNADCDPVRFRLLVPYVACLFKGSGTAYEFESNPGAVSQQ